MSKSAIKTTYSILLIEDNEGDFYLIREYLEEGKHGVNLKSTSTFKEARSILSGSSAFDVILLDLTLPDASGEKLIKKILALREEAVLIVLTGYADMDFSVKSLSLGVSDNLLKNNLTAGDLWKSIRYSLERKAASESVKKSEKRYRNLFQNNPNPMIIRGLNNRIIDVNRAAIEKYGYAYKRFKTLKMDAIREHQDKKTDIDLPFGTSESNLWLHKNKNGHVFFAEVVSHPVEINDQPATLDIITDITEKIELQEKIIENTIRAEEDERNRIAKELHDGIVQKLAACGMFIQNLHDYAAQNKQLHQKIDRLHKLISDIANETRDLSHNLKSAEFEISSLPQLIEQLSRHLSKESNIHFTFKNHISQDLRVSSTFKMHIYRIMQELCNNTLKHSEASRAVITFEVIGEKLFISYNDNGEGFDVATAQSQGIGIRNIRSRVYRLKGEIDFEKQQQGMHIHIELPITE